MTKETLVINYDGEYEFHSPITGVCKSYGIWKKEGSTISPMVYLTKPKHLSHVEYVKFVKSLSFLYRGDFDE